MATTYDKASLVMIPSGYKDDKLYSIKPTDGSGDFTFSRDGAGASPATRVNASGLIEKGRTNEVLQSNTFNTTWSSVNVVATSGQSGYDGSSDAWKLEKFAASGNLQQAVSASGVHTLSFYAKAGNRDWTRIIATGGSSTPSTWFDLANGVVGTADFFTIDSNIESVGGDWYRCSITFEVGSFTGVRVYPADGNNDVSGTNGYIYIQDAQLESGLISTSYIETTTTAVSAGLLGDMPRLDYSGGATCPSLLLEPSRVNNLGYSEYISAGVTWITSGGMLTTQNDAISPEGVQNAVKMTRPSNTGASWLTNFISGNVGQNQVLSIFVKAGTASVFNITYYDAVAGDIFINFNLSTQEVIHYGSPYYVDGDIEDYGNGWYRCYVVIETASTSSRQFQIAIGTNRYGAADEYLYIYGASWEDNASYPTSYIPTYGSASVRGVDDMDTTYSTAITTDGSVTFFLELDDAPRSAANSTGANFAQDFVSTDFITYNHTGAGLHRIRVNANGSAYYIATSIFQDEPVKIAAVATASSVSVYANGELVNTLSIVGDWTTAGAFYTSITDSVGILPVKQYILFPTALTSSEAIALTTL